MIDEVFVITIVITAVTGALALAGMITRTINRHLDRKAQLQTGGDGRVEELEERVAMLNEHVQQLEERVDFTERIAARNASAGKLPEA